MSEFKNTVDIYNENGQDGEAIVAAAIIDRTITEFVDDRIKLVYNYAFFTCDKLKKVNLPNVETVRGSAFYACTSLKEIMLQNTKILGDLAFTLCGQLENVYLPNVTSIGTYAFQYCENLKSMTVINAESIQSHAFSGCTMLESVDCSSKELYSATFYNCKSLSTLIMRGDTRCVVYNSIASPITFLEGTPIASGNGYIYVPENLINDYKEAYGWSTYADQIKPLSELPQ